MVIVVKGLDTVEEFVAAISVVDETDEREEEERTEDADKLDDELDVIDELVTLEEEEPDVELDEELEDELVDGLELVVELPYLTDVDVLDVEVPGAVAPRPWRMRFARPGSLLDELLCAVGICLAT